MFRRFGISSRTQRILLSGIALGITLLIIVLKDDGRAPPAGQPLQVPALGGTPATATDANPPKAETREEAVALAIRWLRSQEGGGHRGHAIARHVGKTDAELRARVEADGLEAASTFYDVETAAVAIVRTIRHEPNDARLRRWLDDDATRRRLALSRAFARPIGRIAFSDGAHADGKTALAVLTKVEESDGKTGYRLLTAYVEP